MRRHPSSRRSTIDGHMVFRGACLGASAGDIEAITRELENIAVEINCDRTKSL